MSEISQIQKYFPKLTPTQIKQFTELKRLFLDWNSRINLISRKDEGHFYERHVLHSLSIGYFIDFVDGTKIMDVGTGGGFPGIPLAVLFPKVDFYLVDSTGKKIKVVQDIILHLGLKNVKAEQIRAEEVKDSFDFVVSRAVTDLSQFVKWMKGRFKAESKNEINNGVLYLKGGDLTEELKKVSRKMVTWNLKDEFKEEFFESKKLVYVGFGEEDCL